MKNTSRPRAMSVDRPTEGARRGLAGRVLGDRYRVDADGVGRRQHADRRRRGPGARPRRSPSSWCARSSPSRTEFRRRFARTMRAMAKLSHPNIAAVYDWGEEEVGKRTTVYAVVEHLSGGSLRDLFDRGRQLDPSQALVVGLEVCRGLDFAHRKNLVHGELTPSKLVFGDDRRLRIVDFGLARLLTADDWKEPSTVPTHVARYSSPEQALGQPIDGHADVYSLALILVEAVTGDGAVRGPIDGGHAVGARRPADAGVGRPRPAGVGARAGRSPRPGRPLVGVRARAQPRAGGREAAPAGADPDPRHQSLRRGPEPAAPAQRPDRRPRTGPRTSRRRRSCRPSSRRRGRCRRAGSATAGRRGRSTAATASDRRCADVPASAEERRRRGGHGRRAGRDGDDVARAEAEAPADRSRRADGRGRPRGARRQRRARRRRGGRPQADAPPCPRRRRPVARPSSTTATRT